MLVSGWLVVWGGFFLGFLGFFLRDIFGGFSCCFWLVGFFLMSYSELTDHSSQAAVYKQIPTHSVWAIY